MRGLSDTYLRWNEARPVVCGLVVLTLLKGAAVPAGGGILLAQAIYTATEIVRLQAAASSLKAVAARPARRTALISLLWAFVIFSCGCALLWGGLFCPSLILAGPVSTRLLLAVLLLLMAEAALLLWVYAALKRRRSLTASAAAQSCLRDLLLLIAAAAALGATFAGVPAIYTIVVATTAMLVVLHALQLARDSMTRLLEPSLPQIILNTIRQITAAIAGVEAVRTIKGSTDGGFISVELAIIFRAGGPDGRDSAAAIAAVRETLRTNFPELSRIDIVGTNGVKFTKYVHLAQARPLSPAKNINNPDQV